MTNTHIIAAVCVAAIVAVLVGWSAWRERLVADCEAAGGHWHGPSSSCTSLGGRPIIVRQGLNRG
ncbi:MAG: hypothetical protein KGP27_10675 [Hyphomicrobiales bacterium]|nr:hypothetical protein [Hyphomicrobiales bacterium]